MLVMFYSKISAQESSDTQGVLGLTKIYLAIQPPNPRPSVPKTGLFDKCSDTD